MKDESNITKSIDIFNDLFCLQIFMIIFVTSNANHIYVDDSSYKIDFYFKDKTLHN